MSKDSTSQKIVVGVSVALITAFIFWMLPPVWEFVKAGFWWTLALLTHRVTLHLWAVAIGVAAILAWIVFALAASKPESQRTLTWRDYREDTFYDVIWHWDYGSRDQIFRITGRCPKDHTIMTSGERGFNGAAMRCDTCGYMVPFQERPEAISQKVERQIDRVIASGEWKDRVLPPQGK